MAIFGYFRVYGMYVVQMYHTDLTLLSLIVAYVAIPMIIMNTLIVPIIPKKLSPKTLTAFFCLLMGLFMIIIVIPQSFNALWITLFLSTAALAPALTYSASMISFMVDKSRQGSVMGNNQSILAGAQGLSAFLGGAIAIIAVRLPLTFFGIIGLIAGILLLHKRTSPQTS